MEGFGCGKNLINTSSILHNDSIAVLVGLLDQILDICGVGATGEAMDDNHNLPVFRRVI